MSKIIKKRLDLFEKGIGVFLESDSFSSIFEKYLSDYNYSYNAREMGIVVSNFHNLNSEEELKNFFKDFLFFKEISESDWTIWSNRDFKKNISKLKEIAFGLNHDSFIINCEYNNLIVELIFNIFFDLKKKRKIFSDNELKNYNIKFKEKEKYLKKRKISNKNKKNEFVSNFKKNISNDFSDNEISNHLDNYEAKLNRLDKIEYFINDIVKFTNGEKIDPNFPSFFDSVNDMIKFSSNVRDNILKIEKNIDPNLSNSSYFFFKDFFSPEETNVFFKSFIFDDDNDNFKKEMNSGTLGEKKINSIFLVDILSQLAHLFFSFVEKDSIIQLINSNRNNEEEWFFLKEIVSIICDSERKKFQKKINLFDTILKEEIEDEKINFFFNYECLCQDHSFSNVFSNELEDRSFSNFEADNPYLSSLLDGKILLSETLSNLIFFLFSLKNNEVENFYLEFNKDIVLKYIEIINFFNKISLRKKYSINDIFIINETKKFHNNFSLFFTFFNNIMDKGYEEKEILKIPIFVEFSFYEGADNLPKKEDAVPFFYLTHKLLVKFSENNFLDFKFELEEFGYSEKIKEIIRKDKDLKNKYNLSIEKFPNSSIFKKDEKKKCFDLKKGPKEEYLKIFLYDFPKIILKLHDQFKKFFEKEFINFYLEWSNEIIKYCFFISPSPYFDYFVHDKISSFFNQDSLKEASFFDIFFELSENNENEENIFFPIIIIYRNFLEKNNIYNSNFIELFGKAIYKLKLETENDLNCIFEKISHSSFKNSFNNINDEEKKLIFFQKEIKKILDIQRKEKKGNEMRRINFLSKAFDFSSSQFLHNFYFSLYNKVKFSYDDSDDYMIDFINIRRLMIDNDITDTNIKIINKNIYFLNNKEEENSFIVNNIFSGKKKDLEEIIHNISKSFSFFENFDNYNLIISIYIKKRLLDLDNLSDEQKDTLDEINFFVENGEVFEKDCFLDSVLLSKIFCIDDNRKINYYSYQSWLYVFGNKPSKIKRFLSPILLLKKDKNNSFLNFFINKEGRKNILKKISVSKLSSFSSSDEFISYILRNLSFYDVFLMIIEFNLYENENYKKSEIKKIKSDVNISDSRLRKIDSDISYLIEYIFERDLKNIKEKNNQSKKQLFLFSSDFISEKYSYITIFSLIFISLIFLRKKILSWWNSPAFESEDFFEEGAERRMV